MKDLKELVKELVVTQKRAATDLEAVPPQTRASMTSMVRASQEKLAGLKAEYFNRVRASSLGMFLFGEAPRVAAFTEIASTEAGVFLIQGDALYQRLADKIEPSFGHTREFGSSQLGMLIDELKLIERKELDIARPWRMPEMKAIRAIKDRIELVSYIRQLVQSAVGDDLLRLYLNQKVNQAAYDVQFAGKLLPVAIVGLDPTEVSALTALFTNAITVEVGTSEDGEVTKDYVLNRLSAVRKTVKAKTTSEA
jgi:hypothetical protein